MKRKWSDFGMIVIFGGSFNPPTIAHYQIANHILKQILHICLIYNINKNKIIKNNKNKNKKEK